MSAASHINCLDATRLTKYVDGERGRDGAREVRVGDDAADDGTVVLALERREPKTASHHGSVHTGNGCHKQISE